MQEGTNSLRKLRRDWWKTKLCTACVSPLGRFLSRGGTCPQCGLRVCKNCRSESQSGAWVCVLCSGGMPSDDLAKTTKSLGRDSRSIRRSWTISNPQRAQTNSPILKSYTVLYSEDGDGGVMTDGSGGSTTGSNGIGCTASTGHLSTLEHTKTDAVAESGTKKRFLFGGSDQGIHNAHGGVNSNKSCKNTAKGYTGHNHYLNQAGGNCAINQRKNGACGASSEANNGDTVNGLSSTRQFHSLPRMSTTSAGGLSLFESTSSSSPSATARALGLGGNKVGKRSFNPDFDKENIKRHRSFQSTLHPYTPSPVNNPPSPATSVNFIEETFWDYYDYEIENSTSSDTNSTPRNLRKSATAAAISATTASRRPLDSNNKIIGTNNTRNNTPTNKHQPTPRNSPKPISKLIAAFRTDSNRSSCERSLGETMDYDCSLRTNQFSSLSDTEINDNVKYDGNNGPVGKEEPASSFPTEYRRHSNIESAHHPRSNYYATISSSTNPYLPASEYVFRRRHDHDGVMLNEAPPKPERKFRNGSKRSVSLNAYDGRRLFSPLRTYCVLMKENIEPGERIEDNTRNTTSAILNNSSPISLSFTTTSSSMSPQSSQSPHKFNSLPRERIIRIEREDGDGSTNPDKYSSLRLPPSQRKSDSLLLGRSISTTTPEVSSSSRERNITRVPIIKDDSAIIDSKYASAHHNSHGANSLPPKNKIERSQSYREISSSSSRPYPLYHHYHPQQQHPHHLSQNHVAQNMQRHHPDKSSTMVDLNLHAGTHATLPNFKSKSGIISNKPTSLSPQSPSPNSFKNVWDSKQDNRLTSLDGSGGASGNFFRSDFDDGSDVVIENFIKSHSDSNKGDSNMMMSNTLPKRKYPPSTTHISITSSTQPQHRVNDNEYQNGRTSGTFIKTSDFSPDTSDNYLRQCSTFPRGTSTQRTVKKNDILDTQSRTNEQLPNFYRNASTTSNSNINTLRNHSPSADIPTTMNTKGYHTDKNADFSFQPTSTSSKLEVPKQQFFSQNEKHHPIKVTSQSAMTASVPGPGSSATLPHPYIRRKHVLPENSLKAENSSENKQNGKNSSPHNNNSGPSISEVEMAIERDIFYQKTRSLDRIRPSSKSKFKSVLSLGKASNKNEGSNNSPNLHNHSQLQTMEIDYSDSQPYNKNKGHGISSSTTLLHNDSIFSVDQTDRKYANTKSSESSDIRLLEPQKIHHSSPPSHPIPSPRLKRKAKIQQQNSNTHNEFATSTLSTPKINGDEMSSSTSSSSAKLIGPGTNYGSKKLGSTSSPSSHTTRLLNEPDHYNQPQQHREPIIRNEAVDNTITPSTRKSSPSAGNSPNLISLGNATSPNATSSMKFSCAKETPLLNSASDDSAFTVGMTSVGSNVCVDGPIKSEKSMSGVNHISQPSSSSSLHGSVTPNYSNSDNPGVNFMISSSNPNHSSLSSSPELDLQRQNQHHHQFHSLQRPHKHSQIMHTEPNTNQQNQQQIKSAMANSGSGNLPKAVRFEASVIAMDFESQQRKLLQQQQQQQQQPHVSGTGGLSINNNNNSNGINSGSSSGSSVGVLTGGGNAVLKSNPGNHMPRHGHHHHNHGNKGRPHHHYVHASPYLPVLYHSYHQQQHKYIRKGNGQNVAGAGSGKKSKSKKYKGFVARAIAKVKSTAAASIKNKESSTPSVPTVYYPVGKSQDESLKGSTSSQEQHHQYNVSDAAPGNSSVITYISPHPQQQHQLPPVQQSLEESTAALAQQKGITVPSITVSLSSTSNPTPEVTDKVNVSLNKASVNSPKVISTSPHINVKKYIGASGRLKKSLHGKNGGKFSGSGESSRMDGYLDNREEGQENDSEGGIHIPDSFRLQIDGITPSSTSSSSSSSFTSNLQESYELFHNQTLPENVCEIVKAETVEAPVASSSSSSSSATQISKKDYGPDKRDKNAKEDQERFDSLNEDEDSDNANDDGPFCFKSFEESDSEGEEGEEPDFVYYSTPQPHKSISKPLMMSLNNSSSSSSARHYNIDRDRSIKTITNLASSPLSTESASYAPFANKNETTTKGNNKNEQSTISSPSRYPDLHEDRGEKSKGKSCTASESSSEPKMVVGIPTYRSPNSRRQIMAQNEQRQNHNNHHYGKSQASIPNANPTVSTTTGSSKLSENVKQALGKEPHPLLRQDFASSTRAVSNSANNSDLTSPSKNGNGTSATVSAASASEASSSKAKNSFGTHKDSSCASALELEQRSNNNRHESISVEDVSLDEKMKKGLSQGKIVEKHGKKENQVGMAIDNHNDDAILQSQQQRSKDSGRHNASLTREHERDRVSAAEQGKHEHARNLKTKDDEDTLPKNVHQVNKKTNGKTTSNIVADPGTDEQCKERVSPGISHDAKEICSSRARREDEKGIASTITTGNSTGPTKAPSHSKEGRLTDLTSTTITASRGQQLASTSATTTPKTQDEQGLLQPTLNTNGEDSLKKSLKNKTDEKIVEKEEDSSVLQARTCSWASSNIEGSPSTGNTKKKNHNTVTNIINECGKEDAERLQRLELVKSRQNILKANFKIPSSDLLQVQKSENNDGDGDSSESKNYYSSLVDHLLQPNSLETQCANDQSFLSESEASSVGKSPSPSPRFRKGNKGGNFKRTVHSPKFLQRSQDQQQEAGNSKSGGEESVEESPLVHHHHLLNASQTRKGRQSKSESISRESTQSPAPPSSSESRDQESPVFYPESGSGSCGPSGMSILSPQHHQNTAAPSTSSSANDSTNHFGRFKSRVLLNSDDLEDDEDLSRGVTDAFINSNRVANNTNKTQRNGASPSSAVPGKKNITTVEISGDVGIVSSNLQLNNSNNSLNTTNGSGGGVTSAPNSFGSVQNDNSIIRSGILSNDHLQSSGLSLIKQPALLDHSSSEEDSLDDDGEKPIEPKIRAKFRTDQFLLDGHDSQSCDNDTEKNTTSDDNSSDWQSESTNTVIFRGSVHQTLAELGGGTSVDSDFYGAPSSYLDPEIQINNITVGENNNDHDADVDGSTAEDIGNGVAAQLSSSSAQQSQQQAINRDSKVNVGYKANKVNKVSSDLIIGIKKSSADNAPISSSSFQYSTDADVKVGSKRKFDKNNDLSSSSSSSADSSEELGKSNETLTDIVPDQVVSQQMRDIEEQDHLEVEMVISPEKKLVNGNNTRAYQNNNQKSPSHHRRESPEGQEQEVPETSCSDDKNQIISEKNCSSSVQVVPNAKEKKMEENGGGGGTGSAGDSGTNNGAGGKAKKKNRGTISKEKILQNVLSQIPSRSSPDGADADKSDATPEPEVESPTPPGVIDTFDVTSDEDSWVEEILFEDEDDQSFEQAAKKLPPPLDLTLHTIVEESCEESEAENSGNFYQQSTSGLGGSQKNPSLSQSESNANELEKYFNFGIYNDPNTQAKNSLPHEESEFSDTFSESSFSLHEDEFENAAEEGVLDPAELASTRLEKYFYNLGGPSSVMNPMNSTIMNQNQQDSDSVGSESDSDNSVLEKRKKVLKHHRRSTDFEEELGDKVSDEEDSFGFGQDGFDTIKKTARKTKKSGSEGSITNDSGSSSANHASGAGESADNIAEASMSALLENKNQSSLKKSDLESSSNNKTSPDSSRNEKPVIKVNRSNSFTWSSDEEVNIMMSKLRQLIKNLIKSKAEAGSSSAQAGDSNQSSTSENVSGASSSGGNIKDKQLVYLENELIRLMKTDHLKNIVEYLSSEESDVDDVYKFIKVVNSSGSTPVDLDDLGDLGDLDIDDPNLLENLQSTMQFQEDGALLGAGGASPKSSPALLAKVMHHIGNRLNMWMKDEGNLEEDNNDDTVTLKCAPSVSSDLNEDRFSWKGSFESALAAKRQSVGSTDSISSSDYGQDKSMLRSSSLHHLTTSQPIEENKEEEEPSSSLPRMTTLCNSLPRLNQPNNPAISRAHSLVMTAKSEQPGNETYPVSISGPVKSARYRPPGFQPSMKTKRIDTEEKASPAILSQSTPVLTQDPAMLKNRSDSMGSIFHDVKPVISVKGQVEFGLQYNYKLACLEVKVVGCRDLAAADSKRNRSDPYVKAYLLPDKSKAGKRKTKTKKNTLSPVFDEILKFPLTLSDLQNRTLWLSVWHSDMFGKNEFLGEVLVNLKDRVFDDPNPGWWDLQEMSGQMEDMPKGDVVIALKWQPKTDSTGNLSVLVKEAKNLVPVKNGSPSTFVKCALLSDKTRKQKTSICRRNFNPIWNQTLLFEDVDDEGVEITIWNHDLLASHDLIGTVRLEYDNPLWESMISRPSFWVEGGLKLS